MLWEQIAFKKSSNNAYWSDYCSHKLAILKVFEAFPV